jgi:hypothetical protein
MACINFVLNDQAWFKKTMEGDSTMRAAKPLPLERFLMELFRVITPNGGSISAVQELRVPPEAR